MVVPLWHFSDLPISELSLLSGVQRKLDLEAPKGAAVISRALSGWHLAEWERATTGTCLRALAALSCSGQYTRKLSK